MASATIPLCQGILAYRKCAYDAAVHHIYLVRYDYACVGGSHAQRDVIVPFLIAAALKSSAGSWHACCWQKARLYVRPAVATGCSTP
jgi:hypothetical protein